jgi:ferredoxin--NADP+ reductase
MEPLLGTTARPLRVAIIGAGPSGLYAAEALLRKGDYICTIDIFNRFPTPFGLVRDGVAPDHQSIKAVTRVLDRTLADSRVRFYGNVTYGRDIDHSDLKKYYDQIIYAVGAQSDRHMGIPGESLHNSFPATAFVGWYNGHPDYRDLPLDLSCDRAIVVGNGNVAIDVTRILVASPDELAKTDIADHALARLRSSKIREVVLMGRRGPAQAAFTNQEIKELGEIEGVDVVVDPNQLQLDQQSFTLLESDRVAAKNLETLHEYSTRTSHNAPRRIVIKFLSSPIELIGNQRVQQVKLEHNTLITKGSGIQRAKGTGYYETLDAGLVLRSVGYRTLPLVGIPFNETTYTLSNVAGRITHPDSGESIVGEYVVGWAKRGPSGLIGNNKADSAATVESMIQDISLLSGIDDQYRDPSLVLTLLQSRQIEFIDYAGWKKLDNYEIELGKTQDRPRVKVTRVEEMLSIIRS